LAQVLAPPSSNRQLTIGIPCTFAIAVFALASAIAASSYLPARRASNVDPILALRHN
jgi:ABC-type lipoprotein release transport system permease subunit